MATKGRALSIVLAIVAIFASISAFASIPRNTILDEAKSIDSRAIDLPGDDASIDNAELLHHAIDGALAMPVPVESLSESRVWVSRLERPLIVEPISPLTHALHRGSVAAWPEIASDPTVLTPDPLGYKDSSNLYAFAGGDPVNGRDPTGLATPCPRGQTCMRAAEPNIPVMRAAGPSSAPSLSRGGARCGATGVLKEVANVLAAPGFLIQNGPMADPSGYFFEAKCQEEETVMQATRLTLALAPFAFKAGRAIIRRPAVEVPTTRTQELSTNPKERGYQVQKTLAEEKYATYEEAPRGRSAVDFRERSGIEIVDVKSLDVTLRTYTEIVNPESNAFASTLKRYQRQLAKYNKETPAPFNVLDFQLINAEKLQFHQDMVLRSFMAEAIKKGVYVEVSDFRTGRMIMETPPANP